MSKKQHDGQSDGGVDEAARSTHFGYREVLENDKGTLVRNVFDSVAPRYDLMNDLMSLGVHRLWKGAMMDWLNPSPMMRLLDVGGGTGDIAFRFIERGGGPVVVCDVNTSMISVGRDRAIDRGSLGEMVSWAAGDAEHLPLAESSVDAYTIAFCIRNVTHIEAALEEARRVLSPGGRFICLEFSHVTGPLLSKLYDLYSFKILPTLGEKVASDRDAYQYLAESIRKFPNQDEFAKMIAGAGLGQVKYRNLTGGIAALHSAWKI